MVPINVVSMYIIPYVNHFKLHLCLCFTEKKKPPSLFPRVSIISSVGLKAG